MTYRKEPACWHKMELVRSVLSFLTIVTLMHFFLLSQEDYLFCPYSHDTERTHFYTATLPSSAKEEGIVEENLTLSTLIIVLFTIYF